MSFSTPAWLFGLLLVPVIWYLHRTGPILRRHPVASLDLVARCTARSDAGGPIAGARIRRGSGEPSSRRRSRSHWRDQRCRAAASVSRSGWTIRSACKPVNRAGRGSSAGSILQRRRSALQACVTSRPGYSSSPMRVGTGLGPSDRGTITSQAGRHEPRLPDPAQIDRSRSHWLLTDGADASVNAWLAAAPVTRVFQVADDSRNVGIARLSARPQPADATALAIQVQLTNAGDRAESRRVVVTTDAGVIGERDVSIEPGSTATIPFDARAPVRSVEARLSPGDALVEDDTVAVDTSSLAPVATVVDPTCPAAVLRAIRAHPALRASGDADARLVVDCGGATSASPALPRIRVASGAPEAIDGSTLRWAPGFADRLPRVSIAQSLTLTRPTRGRGTNRLGTARGGD